MCLFLFVNTSFNFDYKKREIPYSIIIAKADLIVDGTITKVSKETYQFNVKQTIKGKSNSIIEVKIWEEWLCDPRSTELKIGQRLILFLEKTPNGNFKPINDSTGELYIEKNAFVNIFAPKEFTNPTVLKKGVSIFLATYTFHGDFHDRFFENIYFESNKSIFEIYKLKEENNFFKYLVDNDLGYSKVKYPATPQFLN
jgi:hypothetical protein